MQSMANAGTRQASLAAAGTRQASLAAAGTRAPDPRACLRQGPRVPDGERIRSSDQHKNL